ncbi:colony stimulating factor 3 (granulocyte) a [Takifugu flavidus]|uniref:Granulocyte colony-stimulating factor n=1 Tax=Takifugu flavidus TaxID=433684 RepID=A0A5C6PRU9_9TELE|nr:colony stimulating factor 3 (granulocyte) a [Takifugu flavidus]TWW81451.1 hypothetical protein D4764_01G0012660 [Takifugu flavidus]
MNILIVLVIPYMAMLGCGAPVPGSSALVEDPQTQELVQTSRLLLQKVLMAIPETHRSSVQSESLKLNSSENTKLVIMASTIGIPPAPVLKALSENFTMGTCLRRISEGLQLHRTLLAVIADHLKNKDRMLALQADIRDLNIQINKMLKMVGEETVVPPAVTLNLPADYEVQVAAHLTLQQLQTFGRDVDRHLKSLDKTVDEEPDDR